jgi:mono/diheme cytochrome c family protein
MSFRRVVDVVEYLALTAAAVTVLALFLNDGADTEAPQDPAEAAGAAVYADNCASCHGADGGGGVGPALADGAVVASFPEPAAQIAVITEGRDGMPAFGDRLSAEEIEAVTVYTREDL